MKRVEFMGHVTGRFIEVTLGLTETVITLDEWREQVIAIAGLDPDSTTPWVVEGFTLGGIIDVPNWHPAPAEYATMKAEEDLGRMDGDLEARLATEEDLEYYQAMGAYTPSPGPVVLL